MKIFLSIVLIITGTFSISSFDAVAQDRSTKAKVKAKKAVVRVSQRLRHKDRAVTIIKSNNIYRSSQSSIRAASANNDKALKLKKLPVRPKAVGNIKAPKSSKPKPRPTTAGSIKANPPGKLKITLTPQKPAFKYRAYLRYEYPRGVIINDNSNHVEYSKANMPGWLTYSVKLAKGKKYLIEVMANGNNGRLRHSIGGEDSTHDISGNDTKNISRVVMPTQDGWVYGSLMQGDPSPIVWRVYSVSITEMD